MECPFKPSLWMDCLFELYDKAKKEGKEHLNFSEVDALVVDRAKSITEYRIDDGNLNSAG